MPKIVGTGQSPNSYIVEDDSGNQSEQPLEALPADLMAQATLSSQRPEEPVQIPDSHLNLGAGQLNRMSPASRVAVMGPMPFLTKGPGIITPGGTRLSAAQTAATYGGGGGPAIESAITGSPRPMDRGEQDTTSGGGTPTSSKPPIPGAGGPSVEDQILAMMTNQKAPSLPGVGVSQAGFKEPMADIRAGTTEERGGNTALATEVGKLGEQERAIITAGLPAKQEFAAWTQAHASEMQNWVNGHIADLDRKTQELYNTNVDPNRMLHSESTLERLGTILAMGIGGAAQAHAGLKDNPVITMFENQVKRDVEGQVQDIHTKAGAIEEGRNLVAQYLKAGADLETAKAKAKDAIWDANVLTPLEAVAAQAKGPLAAARAQALNGEAQVKSGNYKNDVIKAASDVALRSQALSLERAKMTLSLSQPDFLPLLRSAPVSDHIWDLMPQATQAVRLPLANGTSIAATTDKAAERVAPDVARANEIMPAMRDLMALRARHPDGQLFGMDKVRAQSLAAHIKGALVKFEEISRGGIPESTQKFLDNQIRENPLGITNFYEGTREGQTYHDVIQGLTSKIKVAAPGFPGFGGENW